MFELMAIAAIFAAPVVAWLEWRSGLSSGDARQRQDPLSGSRVRVVGLHRPHTRPGDDNRHAGG
jgi:hypothetical protein